MVEYNKTVKEASNRAEPFCSQKFLTEPISVRSVRLEIDFSRISDS